MASSSTYSVNPEHLAWEGLEGIKAHWQTHFVWHGL